MTRATTAAALALILGLEPTLRSSRAAAEESSAPSAPPTANAEAAAKAAFARAGDAFRLGHYPEAIQSFEDAYRLSHKVEILFNLALSNRKAYGIEQKPEYLRRALDIYTQFLRLTTDAAEQLAARRNIAEVSDELAALEERERVQRLRSGSGPAPLLAAVRLDAERRPIEAMAQLEGLLAKGGNTTFVLQDIYRLEGEIGVEAGQSALSLEAYERLLALSPSFDLPRGASAGARANLRRARAFWAAHAGFSISAIVPPPAEPDAPLVIPVLIENDVLSMVSHVTVHYRRSGERRYSTVTRTGAGDIDIPAMALPSEEAEYRMEYFVSATDAHDNVVSAIGGDTAPLSFPVLSPEEVATLKRRTIPWYASWWFWTGASVVATGAAVAIAAGAGAFAPGPPQTYENTPPLSLGARRAFGR